MASPLICYFVGMKRYTPSRRQFLRTGTGITAGGLLFPLLSCGDSGASDSAPASAPASDATPAAAGDLANFGLQLYTLRDLMPKDPKGTLRQVADMGYDQIEGYEGPRGMFWEMEAREWKDYCDELGLNMVSCHLNIRENLEEKIGQLASIGAAYAVCPAIGGQTDRAAWDEVIELFNRAGRIASDNGIGFAYHNHAYTFEEVDGIMPQAYLMEHTDDSVDYEMDIYWVVTAGADPVEWLERYPNKWRLCHVKDRKRGADASEHHASVDLGTGSIDFSRVLKVAEDVGMEYYILEQEDYENSTPLKSAAAGARYLEQLRFS
jgi:sugar phosphate isomerase/epimerase